jgi:hypothetical protein
VELVLTHIYTSTKNRPPSSALPTMAPTHILFESASGYSLFEVKQNEQIGAMTKEVQRDSIQDLHKFGKMVQLKSFSAFKNAAHALENANDVSEGDLSPLIVELSGLIRMCFVSRRIE